MGISISLLCIYDIIAHNLIHRINEGKKSFSHSMRKSIINSTEINDKMSDFLSIVTSQQGKENAKSKNESLN